MFKTLFRTRKQQINLQNELQAVHPKLALRRSQRARRMALRVNMHDGIIELVLPKRYSNLEAKIFIEAHRDWIRHKAQGLPEAQPFIDGMVLSILGQNYVLKITYDNSIKTTRISFNGDSELRVITPRADASANILRFLKRELEKHLEILVREKCALIGKPAPAITVRQTKTQWGSCSHDGRLSFSWRLVFTPLETIDYVVAHEVAHRVHFNHSRAFWALTQKLSVNFDLGRNWLAQNASSVSRIGVVSDNQLHLEG